MSWQKLKSNFGLVFQGIAERLNAFLAYLSVPLHLFRFVVLLMAVDFVAFMALTKSSYVQLLNPVAFLWASSGESRDIMELYFPRSLSLTGIDQIYPEEESSQANAKPGAKVVPPPETPIDAAQVAGEVILIRKRVAAPQTKSRELTGTTEEKIARRVMLELIAGPAGEIESLKARNLLKEPMFLRAIWNHDQTLYISTEKRVWDPMTQNERKIAEYCITESLKKNLGSAKFVLLKE